MLEGGGYTRGVSRGGWIWEGSDDRGLNRVKGGGRKGSIVGPRGVREEEFDDERRKGKAEGCMRVETSLTEGRGCQLSQEARVPTEAKPSDRCRLSREATDQPVEDGPVYFLDASLAALMSGASVLNGSAFLKNGC